MNRPITLACWDYDRTQSLRNGSVRPEGIDLTYLSLPVEETFFRMLRHRSFDAAEMSLSSYVMTLGEREPPFVAIPVFPSRAFRHSCVFVNADSGIDVPEDLAGRTVGIPEFQMTAAVWMRGIFAEHHGVPVASVRYRTGGLEQAGRPEKLQLRLPPEIDVALIRPDDTLSRLLDAGEIDALYTTRAPSTFQPGSTRVRRLFEDSRAAEVAYFERTQIFPIMHVVALRRDVHERYPWVAQELYKAFEIARRQTAEALTQTSALMHMLPWLVQEVEQTRAVMGDDFWSYGLGANRHVLETFLGYSHEQGLADRRYEPEELFVASTLESFAI